MNRKYHDTFRMLTWVAMATGLGSVAALWSWNTLAPLFGAPTFEFRHAVALLVALAALRVALGHGVGRRVHNSSSEVRS
jgi:hypothetical protein